MVEISNLLNVQEWKYGKRQYKLAFILINIFFPIGGYIFLKVLSRETEKNVEFGAYKDLKEKKELDKTLNKSSHIVTESDFVSLEDSLNISEFIYRRKIILDLLSRNDIQYFKLINKALENSDQETVHYAASSILDKKLKQRNEHEEAIKKYNFNPLDYETVKKYIESLEKHLTMPYIEKGQKEEYIREMMDALIYYLDNKKGPNDFCIVKLLNYSMGIKDLEILKKYTDHYDLNYKDSETKFVMLLKSYYVLKDSEKFNESIKRLSSLKGGLSKEAVDILHFWSMEV